VLYVYALLAEPPAGALGRGLAGEGLVALDVAGVWAVAGTVVAAPPATASTLRRHDAVIRRVARAADGLLPARFGATLPDARALERGLAGRGPALRRALALVRGREQMTLRLFGAPAPARSAAADAAAGPGTRYLAARRAAAGRPPELEPLRPGLARLVRAERVERHDVPPLLATVYHLVDRGRGPEYLAGVRRLAAQTAGVRIRASGPWPPYAFVPEPGA
jgi:hypothetical protein